MYIKRCVGWFRVWFMLLYHVWESPCLTELAILLVYCFTGSTSTIELSHMMPGTFGKNAQYYNT